MKFGMVNKSTTVNRFVLHTLYRNITHLAIITRKTNIKLGILKGGGELEKSHNGFFGNLPSGLGVFQRQKKTHFKTKYKTVVY